MFNPKKLPFDVNNAAVVEEIEERARNFDRTAVENSNRLRTDFSPRMDLSLARCAAGLGARIFQNDIGLRRSRQLKGDVPSTTSEAYLSINVAKEPVIARARPDKGRSFEQTMGRAWLNGNAKESAKIGSLRKNKRNFSLSFERLPRRGFEKRCARVASLSALSGKISAMRHGRSYEALPEWDAEALFAEPAESFPLMRASTADADVTREGGLL